MNINCKISEDLLPLYVDGSCSEDSRAALEAHLIQCPACRAALDRMCSQVTDSAQEGTAAPKLAGYAKKVRRHRIRVACAIILAIMLVSDVLSLTHLAVRDMRAQANPTVPEVEAGACNLTAGGLETTAEDVGRYVFFTNYTQIEVTVQGGGGPGTVMLWNAADDSGFIQIHEVAGTEDSCTFTGLSAANRYKITCDGLDGAAVTVSEGRIVSFWHSLQNVLRDIFF